MKTIGIYLLILISLASACRDSEPVPAAPDPPAPGTFEQKSPTDGQMDVTDLPTFTWTSSDSAKEYMVSVARDAAFSQIVYSNTVVKNTELTLSSPLIAGMRYYWKVRASNVKGEHNASNAGISFRVKALPPEPSPQQSRYYVSPQGEDNPDRGTLEHPFQTLAYAASRVPAAEGDTILLMAGTFVETQPALIPVGVSVVGAGESSTILSSAGVALAAGINSNAPNYKLWYDGSLIQLVSKNRTAFRNNKSAAVAPAEGKQTLSGFTIDGNNKKLKAGVWVENRNNVVLHHVTFKNLQQRGAVFAPGDKDFYVYPDFYMTGTRIHDCTFINSGKDLADETLGNLCIAQLDGADIYNITINDSEGYGIKFIYDGYFKNVKIHDCTIAVNEADSKWGEDIAIEVWNLGPGNEIYNIVCNTWLSLVNHPEMFGHPTGTENMKVHHVTMVDKDGVSNKEAIEVAAPGIEITNSYFQDKGIGMAVWDMGRENIDIHHNVFYNTSPKQNWAGAPAVYIDNSRDWDFKHIRIFNNVFDNSRMGINIKGQRISDISIQNNAFLNMALSDVEAVGTDIGFDHNLKNTSPWVANGVTTSAANINGDPGFKQTGARWDAYYHPAAAGSFAVDKGVNVGLPFNGLAPDIGPFEF